MFETLFSNLKPSVLQTESRSTIKVISIASTADYGELPKGFFIVEGASGRKTLGFNCASFLSWDVGKTVVVGRDRITLDKPLSELPTVRLNFRAQTDVQ